MTKCVISLRMTMKKMSRVTDKTLWPFCDSAAGVSHDCFDAEAEVLVDKTRPVGKRTLYWDAIEDWHSGDRFNRAA